MWQAILHEVIQHGVHLLILIAIAWALRASLHLEDQADMGVGEIYYARPIRRIGRAFLFIPWLVAVTIVVLLPPKPEMPTWKIAIILGLLFTSFSIWAFFETEYRKGTVTSLGIHAKSVYGESSLRWVQIERVHFSVMTNFLTFTGNDGTKVRYTPQQTGFPYLCQVAAKSLPPHVDQTALYAAWQARQDSLLTRHPKKPTV